MLRRVIFRWMTSKNMYTISFKDGAKGGSPEEVLLSFKNKQGTYARIFETLCRCVGFTFLHVIYVTLLACVLERVRVALGRLFLSMSVDIYLYM